MDLLLIISSCEPASSFNHFLPTRNTFNGKKKQKLKWKLPFGSNTVNISLAAYRGKNIYVPVTHVQTFTWTLSWHVDKSEGKKKIQRCLAHSASYVSGLCSFHWDIHQVDTQFTGCHGDIIRRVGLHDLQLIMWYHRVVSMERKLSQKEANFKVSTWFNVSLIHLKILTMARDQTHQTIDFLSTRKTPFWLFSLNNCNAINKQIVRGWLHLERIPPFPLHQPAVNTW